jgi:hypothetical protein
MKMKKINNIIEEEILRNSLDINLQNTKQKSEDEKIKNIANMRMDSKYIYLLFKIILISV